MTHWSMLSGFLTATLAVLPDVVFGTSAMCTADCDRNGAVTINEIVTAVNISLGQLVSASCLNADRNADGRVSIDELVDGVAHALYGCGPLPSTPTRRPPSPTATPTPLRCPLNFTQLSNIRCVFRGHGQSCGGLVMAFVTFRLPDDPRTIVLGGLVGADQYVMTIDGVPGSFTPQYVAWAGYGEHPLDTNFTELAVFVDDREYDYQRSGYFSIDGATRAHLSAHFADPTVTLNGCTLRFFEGDLIVVDTWSPL